MTFELVPNGILVDGTLMICQRDFASDGGDLTRDEQHDAAGLIEDAPTGADGAPVVGNSEIGGAWTGWEPREATLSLLFTGADRGPALRTLYAAWHGDVPQEHRLIGDETGGAFEGPVEGRSFTWEWMGTTDTLEIDIVFRTLRPEIDARLTAPAPTAERQTTPTPEAGVINQDDLVRLSQVEAALAAAYTPDTIVEVPP